MNTPNYNTQKGFSLNEQSKTPKGELIKAQELIDNVLYEIDENIGIISEKLTKIFSTTEPIPNGGDEPSDEMIYVENTTIYDLWRTKYKLNSYNTRLIEIKNVLERLVG